MPTGPRMTQLAVCRLLQVITGQPTRLRRDEFFEVRSR
jgi:hypothetical protein